MILVFSRKRRDFRMWEKVLSGLVRRFSRWSVGGVR